MIHVGTGHPILLAPHLYRFVSPIPGDTINGAQPHIPLILGDRRHRIRGQTVIGRQQAEGVFSRVEDIHPIPFGPYPNIPCRVFAQRGYDPKPRS